MTKEDFIKLGKKLLGTKIYWTNNWGDHIRALRENHQEKELLFQLGVYQDFINQLKQKNPPVRDLYTVLDRMVQDNLDIHREEGRIPPCRKGCSACCSIPVLPTRLEMKHIVKVVKEKKIPIDQERLKKQAVTSEDDWFTLSPAERRCVFVGGDGACQIYEDRPMPCRNFHVLTPPEDCDTTINPEGQILKLIAVQAEIFASALLMVSESGLLPKLLLEEL